MGITGSDKKPALQTYINYKVFGLNNARGSS
jgi:hypothetical protein